MLYFDMIYFKIQTISSPILDQAALPDTFKELNFKEVEQKGWQIRNEDPHYHDRNVPKIDQIVATFGLAGRSCNFVMNYNLLTIHFYN